MLNPVDKDYEVQDYHSGGHDAQHNHDQLLSRVACDLASTDGLESLVDCVVALIIVRFH